MKKVLKPSDFSVLYTNLQNPLNSTEFSMLHFHWGKERNSRKNWRRSPASVAVTCSNGLLRFLESSLRPTVGLPISESYQHKGRPLQCHRVSRSTDYSCPRFETFRLRIPTRDTVILTDIFRDFPQTLQLENESRSLLYNSMKLVIYYSSNV
jgi:hypothetical protein